MDTIWRADVAEAYQPNSTSLLNTADSFDSFMTLFFDQEDPYMPTDTLEDPVKVFNRIEENTLSIIAIMVGSLQQPTVTSKTWNINDFPFAADLNRIEANIDTIKLYSYTPPEWEAAKTTWAQLQGFDYSALNRMERNQLALYKMITALIEYEIFNYSGDTFYAGQDQSYL